MTKEVRRSVEDFSGGWTTETLEVATYTNLLVIDSEGTGASDPRAFNKGTRFEDDR